MSKTVGLIIASGFAIFWILKNLRGVFVNSSTKNGLELGIRRANYFAVTLLFLIGPFSTVLGLEQLVGEVRREMTWVPVKGFVTGHVAAGKYKGRNQYRTRFHFRTSAETGEVDHEVLDPTGRTNPPDVSQEIEVLYDPSNPDQAIIDSFGTRWLFSIASLSIGSLCLFLAIGAALQISRLQDLKNLAKPSPQTGSGDGKLIAVKRNRLLSLKRNPNFRLVVQYQDLAGRTHIAESEPIWGMNPEMWVNRAIDVPLTLDRVNPARAWVRVADYYRVCKNG